jgi:hypothetical protein
MSDVMRYPVDSAAFDAILGHVERVVDSGARLPDWPLRNRRTANIDVCQYSHAIEGAFGPVLQSLADFYSDDVVTTLVLEPAPAYYRAQYGAFPIFSLPRRDIAAAFWDCVSFEPEGDPTGAVVNTAGVVTSVGTSGTWAVWAERSWDLAIIMSQTAGGPWLSRGVPFVPVEAALADFTEPDFKTPLSSERRNTFLENFGPAGWDRTGSGPALNR